MFYQNKIFMVENIYGNVTYGQQICKAVIVSLEIPNQSWQKGPGCKEYTF